jgi:hypothetical protein
VAEGRKKTVALGIPRATPGREAFVRPADDGHVAAGVGIAADVDQGDAVGQRVEDRCRSRS